MSKIEISSKAIDRYDFQANSIKRIKTWYEKGQLNLTPEYQRSGVWNDKERSQLIDTIFADTLYRLLFCSSILMSGRARKFMMR